jgi:hypothetical protein
VSNLRELIALAKSKPGGLSYASSGPGTPYHMAGELFKAMAGLHIVHIPYKGSSGARTDVLGGSRPVIDAITTWPSMPAPASEALATTAPRARGECPTSPPSPKPACPGYRGTIWLGLLAPGHTWAIVNRLQRPGAPHRRPSRCAQRQGSAGRTPMVMSVEGSSAATAGRHHKWAPCEDLGREG